MGRMLPYEPCKKSGCKMGPSHQLADRRIHWRNLNRHGPSTCHSAVCVQPSLPWISPLRRPLGVVAGSAVEAQDLAFGAARTTGAPRLAVPLPLHQWRLFPFATGAPVTHVAGPSLAESRF